MPHMLAEGYPATHRTLNKVGMQRCGFSEEEIQLGARIFKLVFRKGLNRRQAMEALEAGQLGSDPLIEQAICFMRQSQRGLA
jgi:UDP-N-acetylglucosamine acyltransferase